MTPSQETMDFKQLVDPRILPKTIVANPMAHSYSRMNVFSSCPLSYKLQYLDRKPSESNDALEIGAAAHEFFDHWVKRWHAGGSTADDGVNVETMAANAFQKEPRTQGNFKDFLEICRIFVAAYKPDPHYPKSIAERALAFNRNWKVCDWFSKEVMFRVKVDRIDEPELPPGEPIKKIRIVDYKTGFAGQPDSFQLDIYALVGSLVYPHLEQVEIEFYYVKSGFKTVKILNVEDMGVTKLQIEALMMRIEEEKKWKARPGQKCVNCSVAAYCQEKPSDLLIITSLETAATLGKEVAMLEAQAKAKKKALNTYCQKEGPVEAGGLVWSHYPVEQYKVDMVKFLQLCAAYDLDAGDYVNPSTTDIKKLARQKPELAEPLSTITYVDITTRFSSKKSSQETETP